MMHNYYVMVFNSLDIVFLRFAPSPLTIEGKMAL